MKFIIFAVCIAFAAAASIPTKEKEEVPIISSYVDQETDGAYKFGFETGDGYVRDEVGKIENAGSEQEAVAVQGSYKYTDPNGNPVQAEYSISNGVIQGRYSFTDANGEPVAVSYTANERGYVPEGNIIPIEITNLAKNAEPYDENEFRALKKKQ